MVFVEFSHWRDTIKELVNGKRIIDNVPPKVISKCIGHEKVNIRREETLVNSIER
ncbi:MAG: hypothetical protein NPIRA03_06990 [Nitrospirales bacterium]|nr:MAG: hypothetical protein NPIRA03_06990 [Nitrospirales bacterium]